VHDSSFRGRQLGVRGGANVRTQGKIDTGRLLSIPSRSSVDCRSAEAERIQSCLSYIIESTRSRLARIRGGRVPPP